MRIILLNLFFLLSARLGAQSLPIFLDGDFSDWQSATTVSDPAGDASGLDLLELQLANDEQHLFLKVLAAQEFELTDGSQLVIAIDTDDNPLTGIQENGLGVEVYLYPGDRDVVFHPGNFPSYPSLYEAGWRHLPTVSGQSFEVSLQRNAKPDGSNELLPNQTIALALWVEGGNGDHLPNAGNSVEYTFDPGPTPVFEPLSLDRESSQQLRMMTWNTLQNGLDDLSRQNSFKRIISAVNPDIVTFNECWDVNAPMVASFMNSAVPLGGSNSWKAIKLDQGNVTASRYPILENWEVRPGSRLTASLIDLPSIFAKDILVVNGHLRCCDADGTRQLEADAFAAFIDDAKNSGGAIDLPEGTPMVLSGDMNLVGWRQQLETLLTGDVVNTNVYGTPGPPDWDGTELADARPLHTHQPVAFTWQSPFSSYPPSRIDYFIYANSVMDVAKAFVVRSDEMPADLLANLGILDSDSDNASDHNPVVVDFVLPLATDVQDEMVDLNLMVHPNPFKNQLEIMLPGNAPAMALKVTDMNGKVFWEDMVSGSTKLMTSTWPAGIYLLQSVDATATRAVKLIKID